MTPTPRPPITLNVLGTIELRGAPDGDALLAQPKRLAVLLYLMLATPRGYHRRDRIIGLFWPESTDHHARGALRKALHGIRQALGDDVILTRGDNEVAVNTSLVACDATRFDEAAAAGQYALMLELYRGDLLTGFFADAAGFERWLEDERPRYQDAAAQAAWALAELYETGESLTLASRWARQAARFARGDERRIRKIMTLLHRAGDRASAIEVYETFSRLLLEDLEVAPSAETQALAKDIRAAG